MGLIELIVEGIFGVALVAVTGAALILLVIAAGSLYLVGKAITDSVEEALA